MTKFLLLTKYGAGEGVVPMTDWEPQDLTVHLDYLHAVNHELVERGELVDAQALTAPEQARIVTSDGAGSLEVTEVPFPEDTQLIAGYQLVDVESEARAIEIAATMSAAPGPGGVPLQQPIEVRPVTGPPPGAEA